MKSGILLVGNRLAPFVAGILAGNLHGNRRLRRCGILCRRRVLLLAEGAGQNAGAENGRAASFRAAFWSSTRPTEEAVRLMLKTWIKDAEIKDVGARFCGFGRQGRACPSGTGRLRISSRGYMLGYTDGRPPCPVSGFFRFLSKVGDGIMKMRRS